MEHFELWHGSQRWEGRPSIQPCRVGCYEHGPGLYLTTSKEGAKKYAKGAGSLVKIGLSQEIAWLHNAWLSLDQMQDILPFLRNRKKIAGDIQEWMTEFDGDRLPASYFLNSCIDHQALSGKGGQELASWLVEQGIDASLYKRSGQEDWIVLFNPAKILLHQKLTAKQADPMPDDFPLISSLISTSSPKLTRIRSMGM